MTSSTELLGTRLRHLIELLDGAVADVYADQGLGWYRPKFSPVVRVLTESGPASIRALADAIGVTHSAASQTVSHMAEHGLVTLRPGVDGRQRVVSLTAKAKKLLPVVESEWAATTSATQALDAELTHPLSAVIDEVFEALSRRPMRERIAATAAARSERRGAKASGA